MGPAIAEFSYLKFGAPPDTVAWIALALGFASFGVALSPRSRQYLADRFAASPRGVLAILAVLAAVLSAAYVHYYLGGGARIIDATSYLLQARVIADGRLSFDVPWPSYSFRGRFLTGPVDSNQLSVIFPPGYPALLAIGAALGHPMLVGPFLAAALVLATYALTLKWFGQTAVALLAAMCSVLCAALRYHTADTMSHGYSALLLCGALLAASFQNRRGALLAGFAAGLLAATRPVSATVAAVAALWIMNSWKRAGLFAIATVPGLLLLLGHQVAATGHVLESSQQHYYALSDGPSDCFRLGFGPGIGCRYEHGHYIEDVLPHGFGWLEVLRVTGRRLFVHLQDIGNLELLIAPMAYVVWRDRRAFGVRACAGVVALLMLGYAAFYFDGSYPGGGARFFADILPLEHALLAWALYRLRMPGFAAPAMLIGFAVHTSYGHRALNEREGGEPMFRQRALSEVKAGLVFVDTDHGFNLAFEPASVRSLVGQPRTRLRNPPLLVVVARARGDAHDRLLWERLGQPPAFEYEFDPLNNGAPSGLSRIDMTQISAEHFEAESMWPPVDKSLGYVHPMHVATPCVSKGRGLRVHLSSTAEGAAEAEWSAELAVLDPGKYELSTQWLVAQPTHVSLQFANARTHSTLKPSPGPDGSACVSTEPLIVSLSSGPHRVRVGVKLPRNEPGQMVLLDSFALRRAKPQEARETQPSSAPNLKLIKAPQR